MVIPIFLSVVLIGTIYLIVRTKQLLKIKPLYIYLFYTLAILLSLYSMLSAPMPFTANPFMHILVVFFAYLLSFLLIFLLSLLVSDVLKLIFRLKRKIHLSILISLTTLLFLYTTINAFCIREKETQIQLPHLTKEIKAVHLSDIHLGHFRGENHLRKIVNKVNELNPDIIFITGDLVESHYNSDKQTIAPLKKLKAPIYFVDGNHDAQVGVEKLKNNLREIGVRVLENEFVDTLGLRIIGLEYMRPNSQTSDPLSVAERKTIQSIMPTIPVLDSMPTIVLHHTPLGSEYVSKAGADLYLCGHTHGGQIFPLTLINDKNFVYNRGLYKKGRLQIYVSQGSGTFGIPLRLGTNPEITVLKLQTKILEK